MNEDYKEKELEFSDVLKIGILFITLLIVSFYLGYFSGKRTASEKCKTKVEPEKIVKKEPEKIVLPEEKKRISEKTKKKENKSAKSRQISNTAKNKPEKKKSSSEDTKKVSYPSGWYVQVVATQTKYEALKVYNKFKGYPVKLFYPKDGDPWYRVRIGPYPNKNTAKIILIKIKKEKKIRGFIVYVND